MRSGHQESLQLRRKIVWPLRPAYVFGRAILTYLISAMTSTNPLPNFGRYDRSALMGKAMAAHTQPPLLFHLKR